MSTRIEHPVSDSVMYDLIQWRNAGNRDTWDFTNRRLVTAIALCPIALINLAEMAVRITVGALAILTSIVLCCCPSYKRTAVFGISSLCSGLLGLVLEVLIIKSFLQNALFPSRLI